MRATWVLLMSRANTLGFAPCFTNGPIGSQRPCLRAMRCIGCGSWGRCPKFEDKEQERPLSNLPLIGAANKCDAREVAFPFYERMGFSFVSGRYEVPAIGPHRMMALKL